MTHCEYGEHWDQSGLPRFHQGSSRLLVCPHTSSHHAAATTRFRLCQMSDDVSTDESVAHSQVYDDLRLARLPRHRRTIVCELLWRRTIAKRRATRQSLLSPSLTRCVMTLPRATSEDITHLDAYWDSGNITNDHRRPQATSVARLRLELPCSTLEVAPWTLRNDSDATGLSLIHI